MRSNLLPWFSAAVAAWSAAVVAAAVVFWLRCCLSLVGDGDRESLRFFAVVLGPDG